MKLQNLRLPMRLGLSFGLLLLMMVAMAAVGGAAVRHIDKLNDHQSVLTDQVMRVAKWRSQTELNLTRAMVLTKGGNSGTLRELLAPSMKASSARISELQQQIDQALSDDETRALMVAVGEQRKAYIGVREGLFGRLKGGDIEGTEKDADALLAPAAAAYLARIDALVTELEKRLNAEVSNQYAVGAQAVTLLVVLCVLAVLVGAAMSWVITRSVVLPLRRAVAASRRIAEGDLSRQIAEPRSDEAGELLRALDGMQASLRHLVGQVRATTDSIGTASAEIASGSADLSQRTEHTATSLQETASAIEQLTGTVRQTADSARTANQLASSARSVAERGGEVVSQVVSTMQEINAGSKRIADIIGTIDGIAFQTNILALNAAVEAARAGEQGRGFAVVASEVRSLAQRSAAAAREIKNLIGASVEKVDSGTRLVADAGSTMTELVASVKRVSDLIGEISAAAAEQSGGIGQINQAVTQLDQATQQNAALVEESTAAAESLQAQARQLAGVVASFRVDASNPPAPPLLAAAVIARAQQRSRSPAPPPVSTAQAATHEDWAAF
jgi:methyl-accepting chemotaxis protein